jgi:transposase
LPGPIWKSSMHIKKLHRLVLRRDADLWSLDECHFQQHGSRCASWVPPELKDPVLLHAPTRKQVSLYGAVSIDTGKLVTMQASPFNADTFQAFLERLLRMRRKKRKMIIILDNARYHQARILKDWLWKRRKILQLLFLPPYSPQLNPIERVWKLGRRSCTHNKYFQRLDDLSKTIESYFALWVKPNKILCRLCAI